MNIFYSPPENIHGNMVEIEGQEAIHITKALRYKKGDEITVVDGNGGWYEGEISLADSRKVQVVIHQSEKTSPRQPEIVLAMGNIKKRDRLEFAAEKAVELGIQELVLFRGEHSVKQNVRLNRLESVMISAMKQSLQSWLPEVQLYGSLEEVAVRYEEYNYMVAHQQGKNIQDSDFVNDPENKYLLWVGPEGGFSEREIKFMEDKGGQFIKFNSNRLRAETAAVTFVGLCRSR